MFAKVALSLVTVVISLPDFHVAQSEKVAIKETRVVVESDGWKIVCDLVVPASERPVPAVILLNKAAGERRVYSDLAARLAERGIASLRVDLRGHGESINKGKFIPYDEKSSALTIKPSDEDVTAVHRYLKTVRGIDAQRIGFVGASYSGESMAIAARKSGYGSAYVALSPGSFSDESMEAIDGSHVPWLFVKSVDEKAPPMKDLFTVLREKSRKAQTIEVSGTEHATNIFAAHPELAEIIAVWFKHNLGGLS
ncbi:MAG: hypothetical protein L0229_11250 [Blastocatellia bacterium]|nr:hypothetical protein [Blastocatellia bacterium]